MVSSVPTVPARRPSSSICSASCVPRQARSASSASIRFAIEVRDRKHIADVIKKVRRLAVVHGVQRM